MWPPVMIEDRQMGSQTLEILRQGVWASLTGGWFYDPHQDEFCNTFHLYLWLFLLCLPFTIYVYFPPEEYIWYVIYCGLVSVVLIVIKLVNYGLHRMYDTTECTKEEVIEEEWQEPKKEEEGIELQVLSNKPTTSTVEPVYGNIPLSMMFGEAAALPSTDADSVDSGEYEEIGTEKPSSTIDLRAEVHRKNSSESSEEITVQPVVKIVAYHPKVPEKRAKLAERRTKHRRPKVALCDEENRPNPHPTDVDPEQNPQSAVRRHSNFNSLAFIHSNTQADIKPTSSLELGCIDNNNPDREGFFFKPGRGAVRRIRSTALETCCPPPILTVHPNSLEVIGVNGKGKNPLPPPSTTLVRNQHLNLCPYYGSEIVYPIAEQSDEHQNSHGPDSELESMRRNETHSDSDYEENNQGSRSPLLFRLDLMKAVRFPPNGSCQDERTSATSKDALLENDNSSRPNCCGNDENSEKKCCNCSTLSCSSASVECEERPPRSKHEGSVAVPRNSDLKGCRGRRNAARRNRKRKSSGSMKSVDGNCSSLVELDLDWLFDDENERLKHSKENRKRDTEWSSTTTVSLEHDVSKVLQETVPSARSLGAIPKKLRPQTETREQTAKLYGAVVKSESERCCRRRSDRRQDTRSMKENKLTQTLRQNDGSVEGLECLVAPGTSQMRLRRMSAPRRSARTARQKTDEASSSGSNNELSTLLPPQPLLQAFLTSRRDFSVPIGPPDSPQRCPRLKRTTVITRGRTVQKEAAIANTLSAGRGTHGAKSFDDTSDGAVHCFVDEHGNWMTYTFDEKGLGTANSRVPDSEKNISEVLRKGDVARSYRNNNKILNEWDSNSAESMCNSSVSVILDVPPKTTNSMIPTVQATAVNLHTVPVTEIQARIRAVRHRIISQYGFDPTVQTLREYMMSDVAEMPRSRFRFVSPADTANNNCPRTKSYYKVKLLPWTFVKVTLDRLKLLALLDRNLTLGETMLSIFLGILVSVLGATLLHLGFYEDLLAFIFCFVIASCQYSLLKSVQPDAASPTHGFNRLIAYSRPVYFCLCSSIVILLHNQLNKETSYPLFAFLGTTFSNVDVMIAVRDFLIKFILFFPLLFSLGLFPQINTFILYLLEQIDMYIFGGNAMSSLLSSFYCIFRSILAVVVMSGLAYGGLNESKGSQHVLFSIFCACLLSCCYHLSRSASDPLQLWNILKRHLWPPDIYREHKKETATEEDKKTEQNEAKKEDLVDPLPQKLQKTVNERLKNDVILCGVIAILTFVIHASTVFTALRHELGPILWCMAASLGFILHYVIPQFRKQLPWLCIARPVFRSQEYDMHQIREPAKIMWFEMVYVYLCFLERNILYPLVFLSALTDDSPVLAQMYGPLPAAFLVVVCGLKCLRSCYSDQSSQYLILTFTALFHQYDYNFIRQTFLVEYFIISIVYYKIYELLLKVQFVVTYIAPWQITWGSAFHAFAQPFSVPHSAMLFVQAFISAVLSTPLNPFLGSAIFLTSYVRPVKFWERDYNTRRVDHSNTPLSSHLDRNLGADDNNLNSIFYEHLTRSLQHSLCGDLLMGRWGPVNQGDCFVLASDYLNCLVHIIEMGNGLVTFQMRGLEFRGTYCQQREVEAITEGVEENDGCCCCDPGHLPSMLSVNAAFSQRWLAWEVTASKYILEGYSISDNSAVSMLQVFEFRKVLVTYYVKSIIFYAMRSPKLEEWLSSQTIQKALQPMQDRLFVDLDPVFNFNIDEDYDFNACGMTKNMFCQTYGDWITFCVQKSGRNIDTSNNSAVVLLCFALSLLGRRTLGAVSHNTISSVEFFLYGLHALFKGDFRITCARDEWVFTDMDLLKTVVAPGVRMSLKLHQDHFMSPDEYQELGALYEAICKHEEELVISHEGDPAWRNAVLSGTSSLLALRHVLDDGADEYKIIMLNKRYLSFRVIKVNKECVRGLWAGQQQELVYLRNRNPERGSIQNAKQALRNIINSSCDQPIGYPIYVSPLTTSYAETNEQLCSLIGSSVSISKIKESILQLFRRVRKRCGEGCSSGATAREEMGLGNEGVYVMTPMATLGHHTAGSQSTEGSGHLGGSIGRGSSLSRTSLGGNRGSLASVGKPTSSTLASLAGLFKEKDEHAVSQVPDVSVKGSERTGELPDHLSKEVALQKVRIIDPNFVYDCINLGRRIDVLWPNEYMRARGGRSYWRDWLPENGMEGQVVHRWIPCHKDPSRRSHVDRTILLVQIDDKFVPIAESGVLDLASEV